MSLRDRGLYKYISSQIRSPQISAHGKKLGELVRLLHGVLIVTPSVAGIIVLIRLLGWLQPMELATLDLSFRLRPAEAPDDRIVIVGIAESDIQHFQQWPLSDAVLAKLLHQIEKQKPQVIGLDIYRNLPVEPGHEELVQVFNTSTQIFGIRKAIGDRFSSEISGSPILEKLGRVTSNDVVVDLDGVLRRGMLYPIPGEPVPTGLGLAVATNYLEKKGIKPKAASNGFMQLGEKVFTGFNSHDGGYVNADAGGYQILLNYRGPARHFHTVSARDVLENRLPANLMGDRIVLIGSTASSLNDSFYTPYSSSIFGGTSVRTAGVEIQANMASQILSSVLDGRPLIQVWSKPLENFWILIWVLYITSFSWLWRSFRTYKFLLRLIGLLFFGVISIGSIGYTSFLIGWWIPVAPPLLAIFSTSIAISGYIYFNRLRELNLTLEQTVDNLEQALDNLEKSQIQLIQSEKMSTLGQLVSGVAHEINNPVGFVSVNLQYLSEYITDLTNHLELYQQSFPDSTEEIVENAETINLAYLLEDIPKILASMKMGAGRIKDISTSLRTFSRSDVNNKVAYNIHDGIDSTLLILKHRLKGNDRRSAIQIVKDYGELPLISCYPGQLNQVIMNLVANAIDVFDESKPNPDASETKVVNPEIKISTEILLDNSHIVIRVKDNGPGMTDQIKQKIFDKLFTTKEVGKGTGLGLSISQQIIVEAHGGKLTCNSAPQAGAEFIIEIPIA